MKTLLALLFLVSAASGAYDGNGSSQYMLTSTTPVTAVPLTIACWANLPNVTTRYALMSVSDSGGDNNYFRLEAAGDVAGDPIRVSTVNTSTVTAATSTSFTASTWFHACGVFAGVASRAVYLNGGGVGTNSSSLTPTSIDRIGIGVLAKSTLANHISGSIAECAIWNIDLTAAEAASLAAGFSPRLIRPANLVFYAPLVRNITDVRGGITITNTGMTVSAHPRMYGSLTFRAPINGAPAWLFNPFAITK